MIYTLFNTSNGVIVKKITWQWLNWQCIQNFLCFSLLKWSVLGSTVLGLGLSLVVKVWAKGSLSWCGSWKVLKWLFAAVRWQCTRWSCGTKAYPLILEYWDKSKLQKMYKYEIKYLGYFVQRYWPISGFPALSIFSHNVIFFAHHSSYVHLICKSTIRCTNNVPKHIINIEKM